MELQPPQAPPAAVQSTIQNPSDIHARMEATRAWIDDALAREPIVPDAMDGTTRTTFLAELDAAWDDTGIGALAGRFASVMHDDALLRQHDGTLSAAEQQRIAAFTASRGHIIPPGVEPRELLFSGELYAGALALAGASPDAPAVLFMPDRGWQAFTSLDALHLELERRTRHELVARDTLPGLRVAVVDRMVREDHFVTSRAAPADVIGAMARAVVATRRTQVIDAWDTITLGDSPAGAADAVRTALNLHRHLDIDAIRIDRLQRSLLARHAARLASVPADAREEWQLEVDALRREYDQATDALEASGTAALPTPPGDAASAEAIRAYRLALAGAFAPDGAGRIRQHVASRMLRARVAVAAADARLGYYLPAQAPGYIADREERGHAWLRAVVDSPAAATRRKVQGHDIVVHQFTYRGAVVGDLFIVSARRRESVPRVILYTPDAPDGRSVREFEDAGQAARAVLYNPLFESWLLERLPASHARLDANGVRHFDIPEEVRRSHWVLAQQSTGTQTVTAEVFGEREVTGNVFEALHAASVSRMSLDMTDLESALRAAGPVAPLPFASALGDVANGTWMIRQFFANAGSGMRALWRTEEALRAGDYRQAFVDATEAYVALLGVVPALHVAARPAAYVRYAVPGGIRTPLAGVARLDRRYAAPGIDLERSRPDAQGIHTIGGRRYIAGTGAAYEVRFDDAHATWRLTRAGVADAHYTGPAIAWSRAGWHLRTDLGLRGGRRGPDVYPPEHRIRTVSEADYADLTANQSGEFVRVLRQRLGGTMGDDLHADVFIAAGAPVSVGPRFWHAWRSALEAGRRAPLVPPTLPAPPVAARPPWRELRPEAWPETIWYQPPAYALPLDHPSVYLPIERVAGTGLSGVVALGQPPTVPSGGTATPWLRINLHQVRATAAAPGRPPLRLFINESGAQPSYLVRGNADAQGTFLVLRPGQFLAGP
ncbi:MAG TPA: hypothetical protein VGN46_07555 [Luteibacter sp.]|jgi:hypothetical protein|uniref:hypothetical protein n=1 Tax=Luteibacter sp. TaxID=1886636 RepID=UPI002F420AD9